jgi:hypothetical protein
MEQFLLQHLKEPVHAWCHLDDSPGWLSDFFWLDKARTTLRKQYIALCTRMTSWFVRLRHQQARMAATRTDGIIYASHYGHTFFNTGSMIGSCKYHSFPTFVMRMIFIIYTFPSIPSLSMNCRNNMRYPEVVEEIVDDSFGVFPCLASKTLLALTAVKFHHCNPIFIIRSQMPEIIVQVQISQLSF